MKKSFLKIIVIVSIIFLSIIKVLQGNSIAVFQNSYDYVIDEKTVDDEIGDYRGANVLSILDKVSINTAKIIKTTTPKKSNNANLKKITISDIEFDFNKDTLKYEFVVENELTKTKINAIPEHKKAKIKGLGNKVLNIGLNTFNILVTAEDGTKKTYILEIKRKDNNAYLSDLKITNLDVFFNKEIFEYNFDVRSDLESVVIEGIPESNFAKVEDLGSYTLEDGLNQIKIKVVAEDETTKVYTLNITKEVKNEKQVSKKDKKNNYYLVMGTIGIIALISVILIGIMKFKFKNR